MDNFVIISSQNINGKTYIVPTYDLAQFQQYFLPKLQTKGVQHVYFHPNDINQLYKQKQIDPNNLECNLKYQPNQQKYKHSHPVQSKQQKKDIVPKQQKIAQIVIEKPIVKKPPLRQKGFTHFIHIPLYESCKQVFQNFIKTSIDQSDHDSLVDVKSLHATILVFRMNSQDQLVKWEKILKSLKLKKTKITVRGIGIFPVKLNTNYTKVVYLKVDGLDQIIHNIVQKAIGQGLITQKQLSNISFSKKTDMYTADQQHLTIIKTKGQDIIDATQYLKTFSKINVPKVTFNDIRLSIIGSFDGQNYYDQIIVPV